MPNDRRAHVPGGSVFFTLVCERRVPLFADARARRLLGSMLRRAQWRWPFTINALVLRPGHLHTIWSLPSGDTAYPARWGWIKKEFTKAWLTPGGVEQEVSRGGKRERRRGIWQRRFWEHTLESEDDFERHFDFVHSNPVKHKHVRCPRDITVHGPGTGSILPQFFKRPPTPPNRPAEQLPGNLCLSPFPGRERLPARLAVVGLSPLGPGGRVTA
jgi:putative transposase